jgi:PIN domain nuclease of toxin-antitoxin system
LILDTHTLLWILWRDPRISSHQVERLVEGNDEIFISAVSAYEIVYKHRIGKLSQVDQLVQSFDTLTRVFSYKPLSISIDHSHLAARLVGEHKDPFDRMLAAQSIIEGMPVMTMDRQIAELGARVVW